MCFLRKLIKIKGRQETLGSNSSSISFITVTAQDPEEYHRSGTNHEREEQTGGQSLKFLSFSQKSLGYEIANGSPRPSGTGRKGVPKLIENEDRENKKEILN